MNINDFSELNHCPVRAVIINCSTRWMTTLALFSALRYLDIPILVVDCESTDGSWDWFSELSKKNKFDLTKARLRPHGSTLDYLFAQIPADALLLIDSDLEILSSQVAVKITQAAMEGNNYGAGFLHESEWIRGGHTPEWAKGFYMERMWIPFTCLKVAPVKLALAAGNTFLHSRTYLEFPKSALLSKALYARHRLPVVKHFKLEFLNRFRFDGTALGAAFREYDTGAKMHEYFQQSTSLKFVNLGMDLCSTSVKHCHGITRSTLSPGLDNSTQPNIVRAEVMRRLKDEYGLAP
jgi:glycosyltransferase involved in cell wall biosynthesis